MEGPAAPRSFPLRDKGRDKRLRDRHPAYNRHSGEAEHEQGVGRKKSAGVATAYEKPGTLSLTFKRKGLPMAGFEGFAAILLGEKYWAAQWADNKTDKDGKARMELAPGEYLFNAGVRNRNGDPYIFFKRVRIESGQEVELAVALDMPVEQLDREDLVVRDMAKMPDIATRHVSVPEGELKEPLQLWVFFTLDNEPCKSMLPCINKFAESAHGLLAFYIYLGTDEKALKAFSDEHHLAGPHKLTGIADRAEAVEKLKLPVKDGKLSAMPSVMLVRRKSRRILYWEEGFNLSIDQSLRQVLELSRRKK